MGRSERESNDCLICCGPQTVDPRYARITVRFNIYCDWSESGAESKCRLSKKTRKVLFKKGERVEIIRDEDPPRNLGKLEVIQSVESHGRSEPSYVLKVDNMVATVRYDQSWLQAMKTISSSLLANDLFLPWEAADPKPRLEAFVQDKRLLGDVLERALFCEQIVIL